MDKKYQVFISSTYKDLKTARKHVSDTILSMGHFPVGMEMFGARDEEQWEIIKKTIDLSDYYIVIMGKCFGSEVPGEKVSYTQKEFRYAREKNIPILAFIIEDEAPVAKTFQDTDPDKIEKLKLFRKELETGRTVDYWSSYENLATKVAISLPKEFASHPMAGWIRDKQWPGFNQKIMAESTINIKQEIENLINYSWVVTDEDRRIVSKEPWKKFPFNNMILRDSSISNPTFERGLIKVEPYDTYDDGLLVFSMYGEGTVKVKTKSHGKEIETLKEVYILNTIPFSRIQAIDLKGSVNYPYPTLYCYFDNGSPFDEIWYIDKKTGIRYTEKEIIDKESNKVFDEEIDYKPTQVLFNHKNEVSLYACIMLLYASEDNGEIMVVPSLSHVSYIAGGRNVERNQTPRELARWDEAVNQLCNKEYIKLVGKKNNIFKLTADGFDLADKFKNQYKIDPTNNSDEIINMFTTN